MASNYTEHYDLCQWEATDQVQRTDFNADNAKIDAALDALEGSKADRSSVNVLSEAVSSLETAVAGHAAALLKLGNCRIETASYVGTGTCGADHPTVISFSQRPALFLVMGYRCLMFATADDEDQAWGVQRDGYYTANFSWNGNQAAFWWENDYGQMNYQNQTYRVIAFYAMD